MFDPLPSPPTPRREELLAVEEAQTPAVEEPKRWKDHCRERMRSPKHNRHNVRASIVVLISVGFM